MTSSTTTIKSTRIWTTWLLLAVAPFLGIALPTFEAQATDVQICAGNDGAATGALYDNDPTDAADAACAVGNLDETDTLITGNNASLDAGTGTVSAGTIDSDTIDASGTAGTVTVGFD
ncbi:MAG: hypothetical protein VCC02_04305, partial [Myxococcota bacterium]